MAGSALQGKPTNLDRKMSTSFAKLLIREGHRKYQRRPKKKAMSRLDGRCQAGFLDDVILRLELSLLCGLESPKRIIYTSMIKLDTLSTYVSIVKISLLQSRIEGHTYRDEMLLKGTSQIESAFNVSN